MSGRHVRVAAGTTLLDAARSAGLPVASACGGDGTCGRCGMTLLSGADSLPAEGKAEARVKRLNRIDASQRLACRIRLRDDLTVTASYW